eukprot:6219397-Amphidinium_carterae.1
MLFSSPWTLFCAHHWQDMLSVGLAALPPAPRWMMTQTTEKLGPLHAKHSEQAKNQPKTKQASKQASKLQASKQASKQASNFYVHLI